MGDPKKSTRKWEGPGHPWIRQTLSEEQSLMGKYGLRNKKELWLARTFTRNLRHQARSLLALPPAERTVREKQLITRVYKLGLIQNENGTVDDILSLDEKNVLERRLQTIVFNKGMARSVYQARQLIVHGHISIGGKRITSPGFLVSIDEETAIEFYPTSPFKDRPPTVVQNQSEKQEQVEAGGENVQ
jgi:small subunit ribosomal protein S4